MKTEMFRQVKKGGRMQKKMESVAYDILDKFQAEFRVEDYLRERPKYFPQFIWNIILNWLLKK